MKFYKKWCTKIYPKIQHIQKYTKYTKIESDTDTVTQSQTDNDQNLKSKPQTQTHRQTLTTDTHTTTSATDTLIRPTNDASRPSLQSLSC